MKQILGLIFALLLAMGGTVSAQIPLGGQPSNAPKKPRLAMKRSQLRQLPVPKVRSEADLAILIDPARVAPELGLVKVGETGRDMFGFPVSGPLVPESKRTRNTASPLSLSEIVRRLPIVGLVAEDAVWIGEFEAREGERFEVKSRGGLYTLIVMRVQGDFVEFGWTVDDRRFRWSPTQEWDAMLAGWERVQEEAIAEAGQTQRAVDLDSQR